MLESVVLTFQVYFVLLLAAYRWLLELYVFDTLAMRMT